MIPALAFAVGFAGMEVVSYSAHRWLMHSRRGMVWHASHHAPPAGRFERNDLFPACFALIGIALFALAAAGALPGWVWWAAAGITAYGAAYLVVHELFIHCRLPVPVPRLRYVEWLRRSHGAHHLDGGEPYGMLLPLMRAADRQRAQRAEAGGDDGWELLSRASARTSRSRL
jgi:beta-carotene 3-hydroxylase